MLAQNRSATILLSHWGLNMTVSELIELHAKSAQKARKSQGKMFLKNCNKLSRVKKMKQLMTRNIEDESNHDNSIISIVIIFHATYFLCYANCINSKNFQQLVVLGVQIF